MLNGEGAEGLLSGSVGTFVMVQKDEISMVCLSNNRISRHLSLRRNSSRPTRKHPRIEPVSLLFGFKMTAGSVTHQKHQAVQSLATQCGVAQKSRSGIRNLLNTKIVRFVLYPSSIRDILREGQGTVIRSGHWATRSVSSHQHGQGEYHLRSLSSSKKKRKKKNPYKIDFKSTI